MRPVGFEYARALIDRGAEFFREAAVLVFVFALLDKILRGEISLLWVIGTVAVALYLLGISIVVEVEGQRRLKAWD
jgi:hypothetical protein